MQKKSTKYYKIGEVSRRTGLSADTLRYYEKIKLLSAIQRDSAGLRLYSERDVSCLLFIQRAQKMNFKLSEIGQLLAMRRNPTRARRDVRLLTQSKLEETKERLSELKLLAHELELLLNLCQGSQGDCPILEKMDGHDRSHQTSQR